jgi:hypothetical protein
MAIEVLCPACGKQLRAPDSQAGRTGKCPTCKAPILVPVLAAQPVAPTPAKSTLDGTAAPAKPRGETAPELFPPGTRFNPPPATRGFSPLASTMDEDLGLPPAADPNYPQLQTGLDATEAAVIEPKHWFAMQNLLKVCEWALLAVWISCGIIGLARIGFLLTDSGGGMQGSDVTVLQVMTALMLWGIVGMVLGWAAMATCWVAMLRSWPRDKKLVMGALISAGASILVTLIFSTVQMLGGMSAAAARAAPSSSPLGGSTAIVVLVSLASATSLILYGFYLANIQKLLGRDQVKLQPIIYAAVVGTLTVWCLVLNLAVTPSSRGMTWIAALSNIVTFVGEFLWLWLINAFASRDLRVSYAWKRL